MRILIASQIRLNSFYGQSLFTVFHPSFNNFILLKINIEDERELNT